MEENNLIKCYPALEKKDEVIEIFNTIVSGIKDVDITEDLAEVVYIPEFNGKSRNRGVFLKENYNYVMNNRIEDCDNDEDRIHKELQKYGYINILAYIWSVGVKYGLETKYLKNILQTILFTFPKIDSYVVDEVQASRDGSNFDGDYENYRKYKEQELIKKSMSLGYRCTREGRDVVCLNSGRLEVYEEIFADIVEKKLEENPSHGEVPFDHTINPYFLVYLENTCRIRMAHVLREETNEDIDKCCEDSNQRNNIYSGKGEYNKAEVRSDLDTGKIDFWVLYFYLLSKICILTELDTLEAYKKFENDEKIQRYLYNEHVEVDANGKETRCPKFSELVHNDKKKRAKYFKSIFSYDRMVSDESINGYEMAKRYESYISGIFAEDVIYLLKGISDYTDISKVFNTRIGTDEEIRERAREMARERAREMARKLAKDKAKKGIKYDEHKYYKDIDEFSITMARKTALRYYLDKGKIISEDTVTKWTKEYEQWVGWLYEIYIEGDVGEKKAEKTHMCYIAQMCRLLAKYLNRNYGLRLY
jgi:hypothetical protein